MTQQNPAVDEEEDSSDPVVGTPGGPVQNRVQWPVFLSSAALIVAVAVWAMVAPDNAETIIGTVVVWTASTFGWYYILTAAIVVAFVLFLAFSSAGKIKLGPDHAQPKFGLFSWVSMLFAAGIGIDLMFFAVSEPVAQYMDPPGGDGQSVEAARQAIVWTFFHYGPVGWAMYAVIGGAFAFFAYRRNMPLSIRSVLSPIFGKRVDGTIGHTADVFTILGSVFGLSVTLGIGVVQLTYGMHVLFDIPQSVGLQVGLVVLAVVVATISTVSGVEKGIRRLSELNVLIAVVLVVWITVVGETRRLFEGLVMNVGDFMASFPGMLMDTYAWEQPDEWMQAWTLFFWTWWLAWAPFVGLFLARISRGRTLRQFIIGVLAVPFAFIAIFISIFGNASLELVLGGDEDFTSTAIDLPEQAFFGLLAQYPGAPLLMAVALISGLLFYVTSADSGALVLANLSSKIEDTKQDAPKWIRIFWSVATGVLTLAMLLVGGVTTLQQATLIMGFPLSILMYMVMISFYRALRTEAQHQAGYTATVRSRFGPAEVSWRRRLRRVTHFPDKSDAVRYIDQVAAPTLDTVAEELAKTSDGVRVDREDTAGLGAPSLVLSADVGDRNTFSYQIYPVRRDKPAYSYPTLSEAGQYYRLEVFTASGSHGYDVYDYSAEQLIADVVGHYESHLEFLRISENGSDASLGVEKSVVVDWQDDFTEGSEDENRQ
ncbi:choline BCCT transporter BetT [Corynebacterium sputi]|uniref:choline BCCT transporter BetT n=1 Tax=Corynebacterium sputi TaxID=489915 RepID=UPI00041FDC79|nr:choline BCCT transporter BetT [Corynebacterium sputi]